MSIFLNDFLCVFRKMTTIRMASRRLKEGRVDEEIPPQVQKVEKVP